MLSGYKCIVQANIAHILLEMRSQDIYIFGIQNFSFCF